MDATDEPIAQEGTPTVGAGPPPTPPVEARSAEFAELQSNGTAGPGSPLQSLLEVVVTATAEFGRTSLSIADVLKLTPGSIIELDRPVSEPVDLLVQGVKLARGEVVIVNDHFAIRVKEIVEPKKK